MKYVILLVAMLSDIVVPATAAILLYITYRISFGLFAIACLLVVASFRKWQETGGIENWSPTQIKKYLDNARKYGL